VNSVWSIVEEFGATATRRKHSLGINLAVIWLCLDCARISPFVGFKTSGELIES
jgi:hypothetical protein